MTVRLNRFTLVRLVLVFMGLVSLSYGLYILNQPESLYQALMVFRVLLLTAILLGFSLNPIRIDRWTIFPMIYAGYVLFRSYWGGGNLVVQTLTILTWPLLYLFMYSHAAGRPEKNPRQLYLEQRKNNRILILFELSLALVCIPLLQRHLSGNGRAGEVVFPVYFFLTLLPLILYFFPKSKFFWILPCFFIVLSTKRTGILTIVFGLFLAQISNYHLMDSLRKKARLIWSTIVLSAAFAAGLLLVTRSFQLGILERFLSLSQDGGSGRNEIWASILLHYFDGTTTQRLFGRGFQAVTELKLTGRAILAHNDYLEILYDYGIIGLLLLLAWLVQLAYLYRRAWKAKLAILPSYTYALCCILFLSVFSYLFIQSDLMLFMASYLGIAAATISADHKRTVIQP